MLLLKKDITKKRQVDKKITKLNLNNNKKYKIKVIWNSVIYTKKSVLSHLPELYYLVL